MTVRMTKEDGVTVLTLTSDPDSFFPPICQILRRLCHSPKCCTLSQHLRRIQRSSQSALGTIQIMVGLLNIGLGVILIYRGIGSWWQMRETGFPFWLGTLFIIFGTTSILSEKYPSPCLVMLNVILNIAGVAFAIVAIASYCVNIVHIRPMWWWCNCVRDYAYDRNHTPSPEQDIIQKKCIEARELILMILKSINSVLIVLSFLEFCVTISSAVLGIKALKSLAKKGNKSPDDPERNEPQPDEVNENPAV